MPIFLACYFSCKNKAQRPSAMHYCVNSNTDHSTSSWCENFDSIIIMGNLRHRFHQAAWNWRGRDTVPLMLITSEWEGCAHCAPQGDAALLTSRMYVAPFSPRQLKGLSKAFQSWITFNGHIPSMKRRLKQHCSHKTSPEFQICKRTCIASISMPVN